MATEILELDTGSIGVIAKLLHIYLMDAEHKDRYEVACATRAINDLIHQSSVVERDPEKHIPKNVFQDLEKKRGTSELVVIEHG